MSAERKVKKLIRKEVRKKLKEDAVRAMFIIQDQNIKLRRNIKIAIITNLITIGALIICLMKINW